MYHDIIKSPLNYIGGKQKILNQILPLLPKNINTFVDLFAGGCNVGINVNANKIILNDNLTYLIHLYETLKMQKLSDIFKHIENRISNFELSLTNENGYKTLRNLYNKEKNPLDLFVLIAYSFNHQIRFNNSHEFNNPFGKNRSCYNTSTQQNLERFTNKLQSNNIILSNKSFENFDFSSLNHGDFVYCDPPYLITTGSYNDGKRGFKGWTEKEELLLLENLNWLNKNNINFALSNVLEHKGKQNTLLIDWLKANNYKTNPIAMNYANSSYNTKNRDKDATVEVLITNYVPAKVSFLPLFDIFNEAA